MLLIARRSKHPVKLSRSVSFENPNEGTDRHADWLLLVPNICLVGNHGLVRSVIA